MNTRTSIYAAGLAAICATALTACGPTSGGTSAAGGGTSAASTTPLNAVRLAAKTSNNANSFTGTMSLQATGSASTSMDASFAEQLHPSLLAEIDVKSMNSAGTSLAGGMTEIVTPDTLYMKWSYLTGLIHTAKPWLAIPLSSMNKSGVNLSQLFSQTSSSSPLAESQLLGGATSVRKVGSGTVAGVAVTEYTGTLSLDKGLTYLSPSLRSQVQKQLNAAGITAATFTAWIDVSNTVRKATIKEAGPSLSETVTIEITSINQPINVQPPAAGQTSSLPTGGLGSQIGS